MTPSEFARQVRQASAPGTIEEDPELLTFHSVLDDEERRRTWISLRSSPPGFLSRISITESGSDADLGNTETPVPGTTYLIVANKKTEASVLHLFFSMGLAKWIEEHPSVNVVCLADVSPRDGTFSTFGTRFQAWTNDPVQAFSTCEPLPDPRRFSIDFTGSNTVPNDIRHWVLQSAPEAKSSSAFRVWRGIASKRLMAALADQVSNVNGSLVYHLSGPPSCKVTAPEHILDSLHDRLDEGAKWVFVEGARDVETRHVLLASELARSFSSAGLGGFALGSLDSARSAYGAYVKSGSKDTLKALADLRKAVVEDAQKNTQKAQDMTGALWKDLAVSTIPFVVKVMPDAAKTANSMIACLFAVCAAAYLIFSFSTQTYLNCRFFAAQDQFREIWKRRLNQVLTEQDVAELSEEPIRRSLQDYSRILRSVAAVYAILFICLGFFAAYQGYDAYTSIPTSSKAKNP